MLCYILIVLLQELMTMLSVIEKGDDINLDLSLLG